MRKRRYSEEQIIKILRQVEAGEAVKDVCREHGFSEGTYYRWKAKYGGLDISEARRLKELERDKPAAQECRGGSDAGQPGAQGSCVAKMVTPAMRRQAAAWLQQRLGLSERRACRIVGVNRSTCRYRARRQQAGPLLERMRELAAERPRFGYRRLHVMVRREGWQVNHKRLYRLYQREGLAVRRRKRKRVASMQRVPMITPQAANDRWSMDFMSDSLATGRSFRTLNVLDEYSRECLAIEVDTSLTGARVARVLGRVVEQRGKPKEILIDNGPEFTSRALDAWAYEMGVELRFIRPGKPVDNAFIESFNGSFRDECLNQHWFTDLEDARCKVQYWRRDYNYVRPHSSLGDLTPHEFAAAAQLQQPPAASVAPPLANR